MKDIFDEAAEVFNTEKGTRADAARAKLADVFRSVVGREIDSSTAAVTIQRDRLNGALQNFVVHDVIRLSEEVDVLSKQVHPGTV